MSMMESLKNLMNPDRDPGTLYVTIDELPRPRDWGTVEFSIGKDVLASRDMSLDGSAMDELMGWIEGNLGAIRASGYRRVEYRNVTEALQERIGLVLGR